MAKVLTAKQIKVLEEIIKADGVLGKKALKHLLWANSTEPKYKEGECFRVTDAGHYIGGVPVRNFKAKITEAFCMNYINDWRYELVMVCRRGNKEITAKVFMEESDLTERASDNINYLDGEDLTEALSI